MATLIELPQGATPLDFAYAVHTDLGHRCRGAKVDSAMVALDTPLQNGQTVEIIAAKEGGPSRDWLSPNGHYLVSARAKAKVRAWFNAQINSQTIANGRELVEKLLQREGKTAIKLDDLASQLGFKKADDLFEVVGKDEYSLRNIELLVNPQEQQDLDEEAAALSVSKKLHKHGGGAKGGVLVVGMGSLLTQMAKCCKPAPPDSIIGYVTRGKGVTIHRQDCSNVRELRRKHSERVVDVQWDQGSTSANSALFYPVDIEVWASDRQGLLRDISDILAKDQMNVIGVNTQSIKSQVGSNAWMVFTIEVSDTTRLQQSIQQLMQVKGVKTARRR